MSGASSQLSAFNYAVQPLNNLQIKNITADYIVSASDNNFIISCGSSVISSTTTISLPPASIFPSGFNCWVWNLGSTSNEVVTIDPNGTETIDGATTLTLRRGEGVQIVCNGTSWATNSGKKLRAYSENAALNSTRPVASGNYAIAIGSAFGSGTVASSAYAVAIGATSGGSASQAVTGSGAMALGGSYASGTDSFAAAVANNTSTYGATGNNSISIGLSTKASGNGSLAIGGYGGVSATGNCAVAIGGGYNVQGASAAANQSFALGDSAHVPTTKGKFAFSADGAFVQGGSQFGLFILRRATTDATASTLGTDGLVGASTNQIILPNNSAFAFTGTIIARQQAAGGSNYAAWEVKGAILRDGTAASTVLGSYNINALSATAGASAWVVALSADTTNGGLAVTVTGVAATNIRWVATIKTSEVTYA